MTTSGVGVGVAVGGCRVAVGVAVGTAVFTGNVALAVGAVAGGGTIVTTSAMGVAGLCRQATTNKRSKQTSSGRPRAMIFIFPPAETGKRRAMKLALIVEHLWSIVKRLRPLKKPRIDTNCSLVT
jgi:hypothetical protein